LEDIIREIGDPVERTHYIQKLARLVRMNEDTLKREMDKGRQVRSASPVASLGQTSTSPSPAFGLEEYCLSRLLQHPQLLSSVDALLNEIGELPLRPEDFGRSEIRELFAQVRQASIQDGAFDADEAESSWLNVSSLEPIVERLQAGWTDAAEVSLSKVEKDLGDAVLRLRAKNLKRWGKEVRFLFEDAMARGDARAREYGEQMQRHIVAKRRVDQALAMRSSVSQRRRQR
jgi:DNA primase